MEKTDPRAQAELELSEIIESTMGSRAQHTNPISEHAKLGCTLIALLPYEVFGFPNEAAKKAFNEKLAELKRAHVEIGGKYKLIPIGDGPRVAAGGVLVVYIGYETTYAQSLKAPSPA